MLPWACQRGHAGIAALLLDFGFSIEKPNGRGGSPLALSVSNDAKESHTKCTELLLERGANTEAGDHEGDVVLTTALLKGSESAAQTLLDRGANIEHINDLGLTPLDVLVRMGKPAGVKLLLENGAAVSDSTLRRARSSRANGTKHAEMAELLERAPQLRSEAAKQREAAQAEREAAMSDEASRAALASWLSEAFTQSGVHPREVQPTIEALSARAFGYTSLALVLDLASEEGLHSQQWPPQLPMAVRRAMHRMAQQSQQQKQQQVTHPLLAEPSSPGGGGGASSRRFEQEVQREAAKAIQKILATATLNVDSIIDELEGDDIDLLSLGSAARMHSSLSGGGGGGGAGGWGGMEDLRAIDKALLGALSKGLIRVIRCSFLIDQADDWVLPRMQKLRETAGALLPPAEAAQLLMRAANRSILALSQCVGSFDPLDLYPLASASARYSASSLSVARPEVL